VNTHCATVRAPHGELSSDLAKQIQVRNAKKINIGRRPPPLGSPRKTVLHVGMSRSHLVVALQSFHRASKRHRMAKHGQLLTWGEVAVYYMKYVSTACGHDSLKS
jgi:hypothetical protein